MQTVYIKNSQRKIEVTGELKEKITKCILTALETEGALFPCEVDVTFVSDDKIRKLNREHREIDKTTDVLSFPMYEKEEVKALKAGKIKEDDVLLGDIVISLETALRQSEEYGHSFLREACYLSAHSTLHLLGYDHMTPNDKKKMRTKEEEIMTLLSLERD